MKKLFVTLQELQNKLANVKGCTFAGMMTETDPKLKKSCPIADVKKFTTSNVVIGAFYEKSVNRQLEREGQEKTFEAQPRAWGKHIDGTPLVEHNGKFYLACQFNSAATRFVANGQEIEKDTLKPHLPKESDPRDNQGTEKAIVYRTYSLESIRQITLNGEELNVC